MREAECRRHSEGVVQLGHGEHPEIGSRGGDPPRSGRTQVVPQGEVAARFDTVREIGELQVHDRSLLAEGVGVPHDGGSHPAHQLGAAHHRDHGPVRGEIGDLQPGEPFLGVVEASPEALQRLQRLIGHSDQHRGTLQLVLVAVEEQGGEAAALAHRHHRLARLASHPLGGAVAGPGFVGGQRVIGDQMGVGPQDPLAAVVQHHGAVHLRQLSQPGGSELRLAQLEATRADAFHLGIGTHHDQRPIALLDDPLKRLPQRCTRREPLQGFQEGDRACLHRRRGYYA